MKRLVFAYAFKMEGRRLKYEVVPGIPQMPEMDTMQLTLWFTQAVPRIKAAVSKDIVGKDSGDPARLEAAFVQAVSQVIAAVYPSDEVIVLRDSVVARMIEGGG